MSDEDNRVSEEKARQAQREADLVQNRISELYEEPIQGNFDAAHLKAVHAYIFQDLPHHQPGITRDDTAESWIKHRALEGGKGVYDVPYVSQGIEPRIAEILQSFGGPESIKGLTPEAAADRLARLYGDLDHAHGFYEGNSRTLREFTRELASEAGYSLDWVKTAVGAKERNTLYLARDLAVLERAFPDLTPAKAMQTNDRAEYEASFVLDRLRQAVGNKPLAAIIRDNLSPAREHERVRDNATPLTANEVLSRFGNPDLEGRYQRQETAREQRTKSASSIHSTPASGAPSGNVPPEKKAEQAEAEAKKAAFRPITRESDRPQNREKDRDNDRDGGRGGGRGGRGGR